MQISVDIHDQASPALRAALAATGEQGLLRAAGRGVANRLRAHFDSLESTRPNALGGRRTHFWLGVKHSVQNPVVSGQTATVSINHVGLRQRLQGGTIRAGRSTNPRTGRPTKYLAIPLRAEAYGKRPAERDDLDMIPTRHGFLLVESPHTALRIGRRRKNGTRAVHRGEERGGVALYLLKRQVTQRADPTVMPPVAALATAAVQAMDSALAARLARAARP